MIAWANATSGRACLCGLAAGACFMLPAAAADPAPRYAEHQDLGYFLDDQGRKMSVRTPADWEKRRAHVLAHMQSVMGPMPPASRRVPLATEVLEEVEVDGIRRRKISYATEAGNRVTAYLLLPGAAGEPKRPAVLCLHPTTKIGKGEPAGLGDRPDLHYALHLARRGYVTLAPDYPSFGDYRHDFAADPAYASGTMKAIWDNMRAIDLLESLPEVDGERIGCIGHSLGGHNTMFTAAFDPRIKALVSSCGFTRFHKYRGGALKGWTAGCYMPRIRTVHHENPDEMPFDFTEIVAAFAPRPFLACAPERDENFDMSGVQDCIAAARPVYELHGAADNLQAHYPDAAHDFPAATREVAYRFLDAHLKRPRAGRPPAEPGPADEGIIFTPPGFQVVGLPATEKERPSSAPPAAADPAPRYAEHLDLGYSIDDHGRRVPIRTPADWQKRRAHVLAHMQSVMGPMPPVSRRVPLDIEVLEEVEVDGIRRRKISYQTEAGNRVHAYLFLPGRPGEPKRPAVLCLHQTVPIGKEEPAGIGGKPDLHYALHLARRGYVTLAPDYPSFGDYRHEFAADPAYASGTMKAIWDNMRAIDLLEALPEVDGERIGCIGHSLGGHNTMFTAAFDPRIKALVSSCGFTRFHKYYGGKLKGWTSDRYMPRIRTVHHENPDEVPFDFTEIVAAFAPRPFLACAPQRDANFDMSGVQDCIAAARPVYELHGAADNLQAHYPDAAHDFPAATREVAYRFLDAHLAAAGAGHRGPRPHEDNATGRRPTDPGPADEAIIFTPPGFQVVGLPATAKDRPSGTVRVAVRDPATGRPVPCRVNVVGSDGQYYEPAAHPLKPYSLTGEWPKAGALGNRVGKAPIRYFGRFFYCLGEAAVDVPPGPVRVEVWRGIEHAPRVATATVAADREQRVEIALSRTVSMAEHGYFGGDPHLHLDRVTADDERRIFDLLEAEDIRYGVLMAYNEPAGPYAGFMDRLASPQRRGLGRRSIASRGDHAIISGQEYRSNTYGHLNLFLLDGLVEAGRSLDADEWPLYGEVARRAREAGGISVYAHGGYAQAIYADVVQGNVDAVELLQFGVYRGIGLDDWYRLLNCGFRLPMVGACDYPACRILGDARTYVALDEDRSMTAWLEAAKAGRSFATTGPLLLLEVDGHRPGAVLDRDAAASRRVAVRLRVRSEVAPVAHVQLVVNGRVVRAEEVPAGRRQGAWLDWEWPIELQGSSWIAARAFSTTPTGAADAESHTNPVYVNYGGRAAYDRDSLDVILGRIDRQTAVHQARTFARKADVLASFARSRDILLAIREAGGAPAAGHPTDIAPAIDLGKREHSEAELAEFLKPVPPKPIADVLRTFDTVGGFEMQLVAQEPLVVDPVAAAFDADGRLYVCELRDYPYKPREGQAPLGTVRQLRDTDGDGTFDESSVFADGLLWAAGVVPWRGGVYVAASPDIWYLKDTDGDGVADVRRRVFSGFGTQNQQAMVNNLQLGLDHWIYGSTAANGGTVDRVDRGDGKPTVVNGRDFRFHPDTLEFEPVTGTVQFGNSFDDWGHRFLCSESQPLLHEVLPQHYLARNPHLPAPKAIHNAAPAPVPVFRSSPVERWRAIRSSRRLLHTDRPAAGAGVSHNVIDGAAGVTVYRGAAYPAEYHGSVFVGDAQNNLVHRRTVARRGATFDSRRADEGTEFVRSSDNWFRPVNFLNAPDGTLYVLDLSREIIEAIHIPLDVAKHLDLKNGRQLGRIYRMAPPGFRYPGSPRLGEAATAELVTTLGSPHGWHRDTAQRLLFERQDPAAVEPLRQLLRTADDARPRLHALHALAGLEALGDEDLLVALADPSPHLRVHALRLSEPRLDRVAAIRDRLRQLSRDPDPEVRFQAAFSLGASRSADVVPALAALAAASADDVWMRAAVLTSATHCAGELLDELLRDTAFAASPSGLELLEQLVLIVGSRGDAADVGRSLVTLAARAPAAVQPRLVAGLGAGLGRHGDRLPTPKFLPPAARALLERLIDQARRDVGDAAADIAARCAAARLLACMPLAVAREPLVAALDPQQPEPLQTAAIQALASYSEDDVTTVLLDRLRSLPPGPQKQALDVLLTRADRARRLLEAARAGAVSLVALDASQRAQLAQHPEASLRRLAADVFGTAAGGDRAAVVRRYEPALDLAGDAVRGREVFRGNCAVCHKIGDVGHAVGPDLTSTSARDPKALLTHILDPSQYVPPNYLQYVVEDVNGRLHTGLLTAQSATSVTVTRDEGRSETILRSDIESLTSTAKSMMPEGFEDKIPPAAMADLLAYLRSTHAGGGSAPPTLDAGTLPGLVEPE